MVSKSFELTAPSSALPRGECQFFVRKFAPTLHVRRLGDSSVTAHDLQDKVHEVARTCVYRVWLRTGHRIASVRAAMESEEQAPTSEGIRGEMPSAMRTSHPTERGVGPSRVRRGYAVDPKHPRSWQRGKRHICR